MGIKYLREYEDIVEDLANALVKVENFYDFLGMSEEDWTEMGEEMQKECAKTLADDVIYGLGNESTFYLGNSEIKHDEMDYSIKIYTGDVLEKVIKL